MKYFVSIVLSLLIGLAIFDKLDAQSQRGISKLSVDRQGNLIAQVRGGDTLIIPSQSNSSPAGSVQAFAGATAPTGWLLCDGDGIDSRKSEYKNLFKVIGETWGDGGDGAGPLFSVPDLRGRYLRGAGAPGDGNGGDNIALAAFGDNQNLQHNHSVDPPNTGTTGDTHDHDSYYHATSGGSLLGLHSSAAIHGNDHNSLAYDDMSTDNHSHSVDISAFNSANSGDATELRPKSYAVNYIIKL